MRDDAKAGQLPLAVGLRDDATFSNFAGDTNHRIKSLLENAVSSHAERYLCVFGAAGSGKSHLLQAVCHLADEIGRRAFYLPVREALPYLESCIEGLESFDLVCLDDMQLACGDMNAEQALFHLFNRLHDKGCQLVVACDRSPAELPCQLPDLCSRLRSGMALQIHRLSDDDRLALLQVRAARRGLTISDEVGRFILRHSGRSTGELLTILERLDQASLQFQRRLTIPFVKDVTGW